MNSNYEINRHLTRERIGDRMRDAEAHRQARTAREPRLGLWSRGLNAVGSTVLQLGSRLRTRLHVPRPAMLRRRQTN